MNFRRRNSGRILVLTFVMVAVAYVCGVVAAPAQADSGPYNISFFYENGGQAAYHTVSEHDWMVKAEAANKRGYLQESDYTKVIPGTDTNYNGQLFGVAAKYCIYPKTACISTYSAGEADGETGWTEVGYNQGCKPIGGRHSTNTEKWAWAYFLQDAAHTEAGDLLATYFESPHGNILRVGHYCM